MRPDKAMTELGPGNRFEIDHDHCGGCAICLAECPGGAITTCLERGQLRCNRGQVRLRHRFDEPTRCVWA
jgi:ferredoxin